MPQAIKNRGNIVSRVGRLRRHRAIAIFVAILSIGIAIFAITRPPKKIYVPAVITTNDCQQWCSDQGEK